MIPTLGLVAVQFAILAVVGWGAIALLPRRHRELLLPGVPVIGAAFVAVVMTTTSQFASARAGAVVILVVTLLLLSGAAWRGPERLRVGKRAVAAALLVTAAAGVGTAFALVPSHWAGDNRATPGPGSLDLYYYAAEADWIGHHSVEEGPHIGPRPGTGNATPAYRPMEVANGAPLRAGQAMVVAALDSALGKESVDTITPAAVLWVLLTGSAAGVAALLLGLGLRTALVAALVGNSSAVLLSQFLNGNVDALLGIGLALLTITAVLAAADRRLGVWIPALCAAGLVAVYTELAVYVAPAVAGGVLLRSRQDLLPRVGRVLAVSALSVVIAPFGWMRGIATLLMDRSTAGMGMPSPFYTEGGYTSVARFLGVCPMNQLPDHRWPGYVAAAVVLGGLVLAVALRPERGAWIALLVVGAVYIGKLTHDHAGYIQFRAVQLIGALVFFVAVVGYGTAVARLGPKVRALPRWSVRVLAAITAIALVGTNLDSAYASLDKGLVRTRHVDGTYAQAAGWVEGLGGPHGRDVTVMNPDISSQLWLAYVLRHDTLVAYPALHMSYLWPTEYWDGEIDRFVLAGPGAYSDGATGAVVRHNRRFRLIELQGHRAVVVAPIDLLHWNAFAWPDGSMSGPDLSRVLVETGTEPTGPITLRLWVPGMRGHQISALLDGRTLAATKIKRHPVDLTIDLGKRRSAVVELDIDADGVAGDRTLFLQGVSLEP